MKALKARIYMNLYRWALKMWRKQYPKANIKKYQGLITDHAILRYIERIEGRDIETLREELLNSDLKDRINEYGGEGKFILNGVRYTVNGGVVVSIAKPNSELTPHVAGLSTNSDVARKWSF